MKSNEDIPIGLWDDLSEIIGNISDEEIFSEKSAGDVLDGLKALLDAVDANPNWRKKSGERDPRYRFMDVAKTLLAARLPV